MTVKATMRVIPLSQLQRNTESYIEDNEPFAIAHNDVIKGCYLPAKKEIATRGSGLFFDDSGVFYRIYPDLKEDELVEVLSGLRELNVSLG